MSLLQHHDEQNKTQQNSKI